MPNGRVRVRNIIVQTFQPTAQSWHERQGVGRDRERLTFTFKSFLLTLMVIQLSVENAIANKAAATRLNMVAKARVTALQKPITDVVFPSTDRPRLTGRGAPHLS